MKIFIIGVLSMFPLFSNAFELYDSPICDRNPETKSTEALEAGKIIGEVYSSSDVVAGPCIGWTNMGSGSVWYDVTREYKVNAVNIELKSLVGSWTINRWEYQYISSFVQSTYSSFGITYLGDAYKLDQRPSGLGCYAQHPLRYGDIESDGNKEIVLFLNDDLVVFSTEYGRVVFAETFNASDWVSEAFTQELYELHGTENGGIQYSSMVAAYNEVPDFYGIRGYSKLYFSDFDADGHPDILVWRKTYFSLETGDPVKRFELRDEHWQHFERNLAAQAESDEGITGEYLPQDTAPETIQTWLSENQLTWSKGYPSKSECAGQEGELIPEMHDPLLNDPDVLQ